MALAAATIWGAKDTASNNNGGGWNDRGGASTDYSEDDAPALNRSNLSISGATLTDDDAGGLFTTAMVGSIVNIVTVGRREIVAWTDGDNVTLDLAPGDGGGLTGYVGGAVADLEEIDSIIVAGNVIHVKLGTYTSAGNISFTTGSLSLPVKIIGYKTTRGDEPQDTDAPLFAAGANSVTIGSSTQLKDFRLTISHLDGLQVGGYSHVQNGVIVNSNAGGDGITLAGSIVTIRDCDIQAGSSGKCIECVSNADIVIEENILHDAAIGIEVEFGYINIAYNTFKTLTKGVNLSNINVRANFNISNNGFWACTDAVYAGFMLFAGRIRNNQFTDGVDGIHLLAASLALLDVDYNNYFNNSGNDVTNVAKGPNAMANAPGYTNPAAEDFSGVDDADGFTIRKGVG